VRFDDPGFLLGLFPALLIAWYLAAAIGTSGQRAMRWSIRVATLLLITASLVVVSEGPLPWIVVGAVTVTLLGSFAIERARHRSPSSARPLVAGVVGFNLLSLIAVRTLAPPSLEPLAIGVVTVLGIAFALDIYRGVARMDDPLAAAAALLPLPLLVAGPIVRAPDLRAQLSRPMIGMGPFTYGVRRFVTGLLKVTFVAAMLARPVTAIFNRPEALLTMDAAWLGAVLFSLQLYFQLSGWSDMAIGVGRMLGFRFPENFRRPYTAESVRDFWRRWNITLMTALRDYVHLPIAGRENPGARLFANLVLAFALMGLWHATGWNVALWAVYSGMWLALEEAGLGARIAGLPRALRHLYVLLVIGVGWVLLRAESVPAALQFLETMAGLNWASGLTAHHYMTTAAWLSFAVALIGAGPLIRSVSRWRVSVDAATVSIILMAGATGIFLWRGVTGVRPSRVRR
jgi:alginate O-acetyltransferase complex protein AlgI